MLIGKKVGLLEKEINELLITALLHDIGKIRVPINILNKIGGLNEQEWIVIKQHPTNGAESLGNIYSPEIKNGIKSHHEFYNGNGYPQGLKGESIPVFARIIAVADAFDAMTNSRPYRSRPLPWDEAWSEIKLHAGNQFDPHIVGKLSNYNIFI